MLLEILVATAFLVIVTAFLLNIHQARLDHDRVAMDRLRQQLVIENLGQQLSSVPYTEVSETVSTLQNESDAEIHIDPFATDSNEGLHLTIKMETRSGTLTHHLWRLEVTP